MSNDTTRTIVIFLIIGLVAGWLASLIVGGGGLLTYLLSGVIGAFVGGYLFRALNINLPIRNIWISQIVTATVGAVIVLIVARLIAG
ncbi:MAG TPA: GlsB/YeaQ/YmgE family stress response membrane protein [Devosia sp.]|nr:GlsB/YeaQ/YmgE family stress response membrane protein [Devosia sp.]